MFKGKSLENSIFSFKNVPARQDKFVNLAITNVPAKSTKNNRNKCDVAARLDKKFDYS